MGYVGYTGIVRFGVFTFSCLLRAAGVGKQRRNFINQRLEQRTKNNGVLATL